MHPVSCERCATTVLVRKSSLAQTSVQWPDGAEGCVEFTEALAVDGPPRTAVIPTCTRLRAAIERAVSAGELAVVDQ
ncbi:ferredoxin [Streptomyces sp. Inha503]|uniref:ferredoxin n=1 Tax=Streptomyces sp. Inha503 TaxID=3383314 RepID=UPI0039A0253D